MFRIMNIDQFFKPVLTTPECVVITTRAVSLINEVKTKKTVGATEKVKFSNVKPTQSERPSKSLVIVSEGLNIIIGHHGASYPNLWKHNYKIYFLGFSGKTFLMGGGPLALGS